MLRTRRYVTGNLCLHLLPGRSLEGPRGMRRRDLAEMSPRCKSRRALSPCPASTSATAPGSEAVASPVFNSCLETVVSDRPGVREMPGSGNI